MSRQEGIILMMKEEDTATHHQQKKIKKKTYKREYLNGIESLSLLSLDSPPAPQFVFEKENSAISRNFQNEIKSNPYIITIFFDGILQYSREMIEDVYGTYLLYCIIERCDSSQLYQLVDKLGYTLAMAACNQQGSYCVQKLCEKSHEDEKTSILIWRYLKPLGTSLCVNAYGNHCIQKLILSGKVFYFPDLIQMIIDNFQMICLHRYGSYVIQRCFDCIRDNHPVFRLEMIQKLNENFVTCSMDMVGNYSTQHMIQHMYPSDLDLLRSVSGNIQKLACDTHGSNVLDCLVARTENRKMVKLLVDEMTMKDNLIKILTNHYGRCCIKKALISWDVSYEGRQLAVSILEVLPFFQTTERLNFIIEKIKNTWKVKNYHLPQYQ